MNQLTGRDLDAEIAVKLFGWRWWSFDGGHYSESLDGGKRGHYQKARVRTFAPTSSFDAHRERWNKLGLAECTEADMSLPMRYNSGHNSTYLPFYSSDWNAMALVIEAMRARGWWCRMASPFFVEGGEPDDYANQWTAGFCPHNVTGWNGRMDHEAYAESLPVAVCRAAMGALEAKP